MNVFNLILWRNFKQCTIEYELPFHQGEKVIEKTAHIRTTYKLQPQLLTQWQRWNNWKISNFTCSLQHIHFQHNPICLRRQLMVQRPSKMYFRYTIRMVQKRFITLYFMFRLSNMSETDCVSYFNGFSLNRLPALKLYLSSVLEIRTYFFLFFFVSSYSGNSNLSY